MAVSFRKKVKTLFRLLTEPKILSSLLSLRSYGYLSDIGWFNTFKTKTPVDQKHRPIPWVTYPFLDFIKERLTKDLKVFEFVSGNSTLFFADRVKQINSVEHNSDWYNLLHSEVPDNGNIILAISSNEEDYVKPLKKANNKFDLIFIDGIHRVTCCSISIKFLSTQGVIILDDSEREEYKPGMDFIVKNGFRKIDYWGISPGCLFRKATTIFYKDGNCLGI